MKISISTLLILFFGLSSGLFPGAALAKDAKKQASSDAALMNRIDFGNSYIMGQSIKSGAVYLLQRKKSEIKSMLEYRTDYRDEILEDFSVNDLTVTQNKSKK